MNCISEPSFQHIEISLKSGRKKILVIAVPANFYIRFRDMIENSFHIRDFLSQVAVYLNPHKLVIVTGKPANFIKGGTNLCDSLFPRDISRKIIWLYLYTGSADIMAENNIFLCLFYIIAEYFWIWTVVFKVGSVTKTCHFAVGKTFFHLRPLCRCKVRFNLMGMLCPQFQSFITGFLTIRYKGGEIPVPSPLVGYQTKPH